MNPENQNDNIVSSIDDLPSVIFEADDSIDQVRVSSIHYPPPPPLPDNRPILLSTYKENAEHSGHTPPSKKTPNICPSPFEAQYFAAPADHYDPKCLLVTIILIPYFWFLISDQVNGDVSWGVVMLLVAGSICVGWYGYLGLAKLNAERGEELAFRSMKVFLGIAAIGVMLLLVFQWLLMLVDKNWKTPVPGNIGILFAIIKVMAAGYRLFLTQELPHPLWFFFCTFVSVALCEELLKLSPILFRLQQHAATNKLNAEVARSSAQELLFLGAISGLGFGISEGLMYSADYYRPMQAEFSWYFMRFFGVALLHGLWSYLSTAMLLHQATRGTVYKHSLWMSLVGSMSLHTLYNTTMAYQSYFLGFLVISITIVVVVLVSIALRTSQESAVLAPESTTK